MVCAPDILLFPENFLVKHITKSKILSQNAFCSPKLKSWLRAWLTQGSRTQSYVSAVHNCKNTRLRECLVE